MAMVLYYNISAILAHLQTIKKEKKKRNLIRTYVVLAIINLCDQNKLRSSERRKFS